MEKFGCFVDIGCGVPSMIPIDLISVSRISHPSDRFTVGQSIQAIVTNVTADRIFLSHKELLGTWQENADLFAVGETVSGLVRSVESYGIFVELTPNLAGLAEPKENVTVGERASVYLKALIPEKMKVKLILVDAFANTEPIQSISYFVHTAHMDHWQYSPANAIKRIETHFAD
jgi:small subunit ribosomal protein S1